MDTKTEDQELPDYRDQNGEYLPLSIESLNSGIATDFDIFMRTGGGYFLIKPRNMELQPHIIPTMKAQTPYLYLRATDRDLYFKAMDKKIASVMKNPSYPLRAKASLLTDYAVDLVDRIFQDPGNPQTMADAKLMTQHCTDFIMQHPHAFLHLVELSGHDHYTYAHSVGVCSYSLALGHSLGYTPEKLSDIGLAGILHDVGKCMVDSAIINKKAPLNPEEWAAMKKHPTFGAEILRRHKNLDPLIILSAEAHHENLVGSGYPKGLLQSKLDPMVSIVTMADAFSALTTKRSYSQARDSMSALMLMKDNLGVKFESELFRKFVQLFLDPIKKAA